MKIHDLKIETEFFDAIASGLKTFEIRRNDRDYTVGDIINLCEYNDNGYTNREIRRLKITYISDYMQFDNYVVMGFDCNPKIQALEKEMSNMEHKINDIKANYYNRLQRASKMIAELKRKLAKSQYRHQKATDYIDSMKKKYNLDGQDKEK